MPIDLEHPFIDALTKKYKAEISDGISTVLVYLKNPVGIGEHSQFISELDKAVLKISNAEENLRTILKHFEKLTK